MAVLTAPLGLVAALITTATLAAKRFLASKPTQTWSQFMHDCNCGK